MFLLLGFNEGQHVTVVMTEVAELARESHVVLSH